MQFHQHGLEQLCSSGDSSSDLNHLRYNNAECGAALCFVFKHIIGQHAQVDLLTSTKLLHHLLLELGYFIADKGFWNIDLD